MKSKRKSLILGLIGGLVMPVIAFFVIYFINFSHISVGSFLNMIVKSGVSAKGIALLLVANLLVFFVFIWKNNMHGARGVIFGTLVYVVIDLIFYFS